MFYKSVSAAVLAIALVGCASVPMGDSRQDSQLKSFSSKQGVAGLYIYRNESFGAAIPMSVTLDGKPVGQTAAKTYFYVEVDPGRHTIKSSAQNDDTIEVDANAGKLYYVWQEVKMGLLFARTKLHLVDESEGRKGVSESQLAASARPPSAYAPEHMQRMAARNVFYPNDPGVTPSDAKRVGPSSFTVEHLARNQNCGDVPALLVSKDGPYEKYELQCKNRRTMRATCEYHECRIVE